MCKGVNPIVIKAVRNIYDYRELVMVLVWKSIIVRYKQSYLGIAWVVIKPLIMTLVFMLVRSFVGIETGGIPYPVLTFAALMPWIFFQETTSEGVASVVNNSTLIRKIYFPREILPITAAMTKLMDLGINFLILAAMMVYYQILPTVHILWVPLIVLYTMVIALCINMAGSAIYVYYRDIGAALPALLSLLMYATPIIYPLTLVEKTFLVNRVAGTWSESLFTLYKMNPLVGVIDAFQKAMLQGKAPDFSIIWPGAIVIALLLPVSYVIFKRAENYFADVI